MQEKKRIALIWLRNDLRTTDHYGFYKASKECDQIFAYYTFDKSHFEETPWGFKKSGKFRTKFLLETVRDLQKELSKKNIVLIIEQNSADDGIPKWIEKLQVTDLYFQNEWTSEERNVSEKLKKNLSEEIINVPSLFLPRILYQITKPGTINSKIRYSGSANFISFDHTQ